MGDRSMSAHIFFSILQPVLVIEVGTNLPLRPNELDNFPKLEPTLLSAEFGQLIGGWLLEHWQERNADAEGLLSPAFKRFQFRPIRPGVAGISAAQLSLESRILSDREGEEPCADRVGDFLLPRNGPRGIAE